MAIDPLYNSVVLALPMYGENNGIIFDDLSPTKKTVTVAGNAKTVSSNYKSYGASLGLDGTGDCLKIVDHADFAFGTVNFCIECYFKLASTASGVFMSFLGQRTTSSSGYAFDLYRFNNTVIGQISNTGSGSTHGASASFTADTVWHHAVLERVGNVLGIAIDGVFGPLNDMGSAISIFNSSAELNVGATSNGSTSYTNGYIQDVRITKSARYNHTNFTPPGPQWSESIVGTISETLTADNFNIRAHRISDGKRVGNMVGTAPNFALEVLRDANVIEPVMVTVFPDQGNVWRKSTAYSVGNKIFPTDAIATPYYYTCIQAGTSSATEPTWGTGTITDGTAQWTRVERLAQPVTHGPLLPA